MSCRVPDFAAEEDATVLPRKIRDPAGEDFVDLLWQKGLISRRRSPDRPYASSALPSRTDPYASSGVSSHAAAAGPMASAGLFMEEDEMASWLYYPLGGDDDTGGVGSVNPPEQPREAAAAAAAAAVAELEHGFSAAMVDPKVEQDGRWAASGRPPRHPETRGRSATGLGDSLPPPTPASGESTAVDSSVTPEQLVSAALHGTESRVSSGDARGEAAASEHGPASSSGVSGEVEREGEDEAAGKAAARGGERKRKARDDEDFDSHSEDGEFESGGKRGDARRSASARRARAAEVHNLSERRRRDRINEKMKALQQLIPRCNKADKASMLDDAIEYMKYLKMQIQMMSMYCNMAPVMFPGVQQYMPSVGMGIPMGMGVGMGVGMGMGMGMEMASGGLSRPMMPFPAVIPGAQMVANGAAQLSQTPPLRPPHAPVADPIRLQATSHADPASSSACVRTPGAVQMPSLAGFPHQLYPQNYARTGPGTSKVANMPENFKLG